MLTVCTAPRAWGGNTAAKSRVCAGSGRRLRGRPDHARPRPPTARTWSSGSAPPVWVSRRRCTGSLEAFRYSVELKTNMGSGSRLVPGEGTDHNHGHFYCLALFRLGNRKWEAESHLGGATRDEGGRGDFPLPGAAPQTTVRGTPTTHAPIPPAEGPLSEWWPSHPRRGQALMQEDWALLSYGRGTGRGGKGVARTGRAPPGQSGPQVCTTPATTVPTSQGCPGASGEQVPIGADTLTRTGRWTPTVMCYSEWFLSAKDS